MTELPPQYPPDDEFKAPEKAAVLVFSTKGAGSNEEGRICALLSRIPNTIFPFNRRSKKRSLRELIAQIKSQRPRLVVMEGTGLAGGLACFYARLKGSRYVVSSGDAVGPWVGTKSRLLVAPFLLYERMLCRWASGYIGWTPYLVGRALTFGTPRAMTAAGWSPVRPSPEDAADLRCQVRKQLGIAEDVIVVGIVGSIVWSGRYGYCYGLELVRAVQRINRPDVHVLIVGDGDGLSRLKQAAQSHPRIHFTGNVPANKTLDYMCAMDLGSLPQSVDQVGSFRYTTKISEYLAAGLTVITGEIPLAYDFHGDWLMRLPGDNPWSERYITALAEVMQAVSHQEVARRRQSCPNSLPEFDQDKQIERTTEFVKDLLNA